MDATLEERLSWFIEVDRSIEPKTLVLIDILVEIDKWLKDFEDTNGIDLTEVRKKISENSPYF